MHDCKIPEKLLVLLAGQSNMDGRSYAGADDFKTAVPYHLSGVERSGQQPPRQRPLFLERSYRTLK